MTKFLLPFLPLLLLVSTAFAQEKPFPARIDITPVQKLSVQHLQTIKTFDTFARDTLTTITGKSTLDGLPAAAVVLDMAERPQAYASRNLIYIRNKPFRLDFKELKFVPEAEQNRIIEEGTVSLAFWLDPHVQEAMNKIASTATIKVEAMNQITNAAGTLAQLLDYPRFRVGLPNVAFVPPTSATHPNEKPWRTINDLAPHSALARELMTAKSITIPAAPGDVDQAIATKLVDGELSLARAWAAQDVDAVNTNLRDFAATVVTANPAAYPSETKRNVEVYYNRFSRLTLPGAALYFVAFVLFLLALRTGGRRLVTTAIVFLTLGLLVHVIGIGVRWWLIEKSVGGWFYSIPIKNQFESVLFSAFAGVLLTAALVTYRAWVRVLPKFARRYLPEKLRGRAVFGAAGSFVGWLSLVAIFAAPYVTGREIGGQIGQVNGILLSYWLYIHVTMVVASYAMIGMTFLMGCVWLFSYYKNYGTLDRRSSRRGGGAGLPNQAESTTSGSNVIGILLPRFALAGASAGKEPSGRPVGGVASREEVIDDDAELAASGGTQFLATVDQCNLVLLQLSFWTLGVGIVLGAVWADMSWGRPWAWDPKETFALITWIVYLIVIHVRLVTVHRGWWTAVLSVIGFFVMLFNWIGVNFFLAGLHSYA